MQVSYKFTSIASNGTKEHMDLTRADLVRRYPSINSRDFHIIDRNLRFRNSAIVIREKIIIIKLHFIRCIINPEYVLLVRGTTVDNRQLVLLENSLTVNTGNNSTIPFELRVLETIFITIRDYFDDITMDTLAPQMAIYYDALDSNKLVEAVKNKGFSELYKYILTTQSTVEDIRDMLIEIADWDEDALNNFYISQADVNTKDNDRNEAINNLINEYKSHFEENTDDLNKMIKLMDLVIKLTNIDLADTRNKMAKFDVNINIFMVAITLGGLIASSFGMNVPNHLEEAKFAFIVISICIVAIVALIYTGGKFIFSKKIKHV